MTFTAENIFFLGAVLIFASIVISKWGYRFGVPTLLLFLFTGMLFGSDGLGLEFNSHEDAQLIGMLLLMMIFFIFPTNFAVVATRQLGLRTELITIIMVGLDVVAFFVGMLFGGVMNRFRQSVKYFAPVFFLLGYATYLVPDVLMVMLGSACYSSCRYILPVISRVCHRRDEHCLSFIRK